MLLCGRFAWFSPHLIPADSAPAAEYWPPLVVVLASSKSHCPADEDGCLPAALPVVLRLRNAAVSPLGSTACPWLPAAAPAMEAVAAATAAAPSALRGGDGVAAWSMPPAYDECLLRLCGVFYKQATTAPAAGHNETAL
jgi:hypothetical protein